MLRLITLSLLAAVCLCLDMQSAAAQNLPSLPGTHWELLSLTGKGEKITDAQNPADVEFLKSGKWGILHYGGRREAGTYQIKGDRLIMKTEDGELYSDSRMTYKVESKILELDSGEYLMRLRYSTMNNRN